MTKWVVAFILTIFATGNGFPIFFSEQIFRSLDQLDEALVNGEILQEYYDEAVDFFTGFGNAKSQLISELFPTDAVVANQRSFPEWRYSALFRQDLESNLASVRYDRVLLRGTKYSGAVGLEKRSSQSHLLRNFSFSTWGPGWRFQIGKLNTEYASGVTVGHPGLHREFHSSDDFNSSIPFPTQHRKNGVEFSHEFRRYRVSAFASRLEGERFFNQSVGVDFIRTFRKTDVGFAILRQQVGKFGSASRTWNYLAPHLRMGPPDRNLTTESSFQIDGTAAHLIQCEFRSKELLQSIILFSYATMYQNLESGGYAYSDYDDATIDEVGLEYREKRAGRRGIAVEQKFHVKAETVAGQLVRWENRLNGRQCIAGRLTFEQSGRLRILDRIRIQAIYQDLDLELSTDIRKLFTVTTEFHLAKAVTYENQHKIEQRVLNSAKKHPFRSRHDFTLKITPSLESALMINYYDSDLDSDNNAQFTLGLGQELTQNNFRFASRIQSRYKLATRRLDNWELRINLELVL